MRIIVERNFIFFKYVEICQLEFKSPEFPAQGACNKTNRVFHLNFSTKTFLHYGGFEIRVQ